MSESNKLKTYIPYHIHSEYSLLDSCTKFTDYVDLAIKYGCKAFVSTEHGKPMGWISKKMHCDKVGIRFIHGVEIYLTESLDEKVRDNYHTILIAKNFDGVKELNALVSKSCDEEHFYYTNRLTFDEFLNISDNILSTSACLASPLNKLPDTHPMYLELARKYDFLEIQPHAHPDQIAYNRKLYELSLKLNKPLIAGTDTHSSSKYKTECRDILLLAKHKNYGDEDVFDLTYKTYEELVDMFQLQNAVPKEVYLQAIENTNLIYDLTEDFEIDKSIKYPILYGSREADSRQFAETVERKFKEKVNSGIIPEHQVEAFRNAIDEEMRVFQKLKMDGFMLSMSELICWCKEQGMAIGTARGSVGGSRVAYITDIIDLNPETWHTVFSRFCNEDRVEIGDIDIDCVESDRPYIFQHIIERFGADKTARVASFGTIQSKGVIDDAGRALALKWEESHEQDTEKEDNPWSLKNIARIKDEFDASPDKTKEKYPELFYYYDGLLDTKISQSVHPAGMVISPISLVENYGVFDKDGEMCLMMDMDEAHEVGVAKYDFLVLKTVQVIRDTCRYLNIPYPQSHEINWNDEDVWKDILTSPGAIFQFESAFAFESLKKYQPKSLFDMSLVTACIRPSGTSYRDNLLARKPNKNPSELIDNLLSDNNGYLVYQEDVIKFLQLICGLSGSEADNTRRAIGRKDRERLEKALPKILDGYCQKSDKPREEAEEEAKTFLQILEDSASYMFGYNHSIAYCMLGYLCAYFRHYHTIEFITSFLNNAANDNDIQNGTALAKRYGIKISLPKFGYSGSEYTFNKEDKVIAKGVSSVKYLSASVANTLYELSKQSQYDYFMDALYDITHNTPTDLRQLEVLIKIDYFSRFGNQRELFRILDTFDKIFKRGEVKQIKKENVVGTPLQEIFEKYSNGKTKDGKESKSYAIIDVRAAMRDYEDMIKELQMPDLGDILKVQNFKSVMGYIGYVSGNETDRRKLFIKDIFPVKRKRDGKQFGYQIITQSIGSGIEGRFTVFNRLYNNDPIKKDDIIFCNSYVQENGYYTLTGYYHIYN